MVYLIELRKYFSVIPNRKGDSCLKRFWRSFFLMLCVTVFLTGCLGIASGVTDVLKEPKPIIVSVMLQEAEGMTIKGENPVQIKAGENAAFEVEIAEGYKIDSLSNGAVYEDGVITVSEVKYPTTVETQTRTLGKYLMTVTNNPEMGKIRSSVPGGKVQEDTEVTLSVTPAEGMVFLGYSIGGLASGGAEVVCTTPEYTFTLTEEVEVFTNYYNVGDGRLIIYESNGGDQPTQYDTFSN